MYYLIAFYAVVDGLRYVVGERIDVAAQDPKFRKKHAASEWIDRVEK